MPEPKIGPNRGNAGKGRPKGARNKATASLKDAAREYTADAINALVSIVKSQAEPAAARVAAANAILDRGYGKPTQPIAGDGDADPLTLVTHVILSAPGYDDSTG